MKQILVIAFLIVSGNINAQRFKFIETEEGVSLTDSGKKIFHYQSKTKSLNGKYPRAHYIHPLYGFDEEALTEDFPADHYHHRGIFSAWHQVFASNRRVGDGWDCKNISWEVSQVKSLVRNDTAALFIVCYWNSDSLKGIKTSPQRFLREEYTVRYHSLHTNTRIFDFSLKLYALSDTVKLGASEDAKHYSGFSTRLALPNDVRFFDGNKEISPELNGNAAGQKITMKGSFGAKKDIEYTLEAVHPGENAYRWILRREKSMQNIAVPGDDSYIVIVPGKPVTMQYRLYITRKP